MAETEQRNRARLMHRKAAEYLDSAEDNPMVERFTVASGDAIHSGICAKDAIMFALAAAQAQNLVRRARSLVELLKNIVLLGR